ncbi:MAG: hypothetical protein OCD76_10350 [Reichenbachiella sp.]
MKISLLLTVFLLVLNVSLVFCQNTIRPVHVFDSIPRTSWSGKEKGEILSEQKKLAFLEKLPKGERVEFIMDYDEHGGDTTYWELSLHGLYCLDLDFDGDLDLLYTGQNGSMMQSGTKIYYNQNGVLRYHSNLRDGIMDIRKTKEEILVYTLFVPCCDSFTERIDEYVFSKSDTAVFNSSISIIGRITSLYNGMVDFSEFKKASVKDVSIYMLPTDLRRGTGYFRQRDKEISDLLRQRKVVSMTELKGEVNVQILAVARAREGDFTLVITEPLFDLPKFPESLYEWSEGDGRRLVGWIKSEELQ